MRNESVGTPLSETLGYSPPLDCTVVLALPGPQLFTQSLCHGPSHPPNCAAAKEGLSLRNAIAKAQL
jgi:hypothetical protein